MIQDNEIQAKPKVMEAIVAHFQPNVITEISFSMSFCLPFNCQILNLTQPMVALIYHLYTFLKAPRSFLPLVALTKKYPFFKDLTQ